MKTKLKNLVIQLIIEIVLKELQSLKNTYDELIKNPSIEINDQIELLQGKD